MWLIHLLYVIDILDNDIDLLDMFLTVTTAQWLLSLTSYIVELLGWADFFYKL